MPDHPFIRPSPGQDSAEQSARLSASRPGLPEIFIEGERILKAAAPSDQHVQRIAVLGDVTTDLLTRAIAYALVQENVFPVLHQTPFGTIAPEILDRGSALHRFRPELTLLAPDWHTMVQDLPLSASQDEVDAALAGTITAFRTMWQVLIEEHGCRILQHALVPPCWRYVGQAERTMPAAIANQVRRLNTLLADAAGGHVHWVELDRLAETLGTRTFANDRAWLTARLGFDQRFLPEYIPYFRAAWRSACGRAKKVLTLDLDNTLWGGVIGDDGSAGLVLGAGTPAGEAYLAWQHYLSALRARGVILAVCSKNAPHVAETGFMNPAMALKRTDFAAFNCSWQDKARNLRQIATDLNVGLDAIVFADDNPAECDLVTRELPEVAVVHLGDDPHRFIEVFDEACWFNSSCVTATDMTRGEAYTARTRAAAEQAAATDIGGYLSGLAMVGTLARPGEGDFDRVAQLELKTNQFNLTTRRYQPAEIRAYMEDPDALVLALQLRDKFGNHGLVSTLFAKYVDGALRIDSWLMSCRVFGRSAESFVMQRVIAAADLRGAVRVAGEYRPTAKNGVVSGLYEQLGFERDGSGWVRTVGRSTADLVTFIQDETAQDVGTRSAAAAWEPAGGSKRWI